MKRLPPTRLASLTLPLLAAALLAAPTVSAQAIDQRYDPANVNNRIDNPRFQRRMTQSAQSVAESLVGRGANGTDQRVLGQFTEQQTQLLRQLQNAADQMPNGGAGAGYNNANGGLDQRSVDQLMNSPEGRYVLEEIMRGQNGRAQPNNGYRPQQNAYPPSRGGFPQQGYPQQGYPQQAYPQNGYPQDDGYPSDADPYGGYPQQGPRPSAAQAMGATILHDITNAAILRATQPKIIYQQAPQPRP